MESAWAAAERGALSEAVTILEDCRRALSQCVASQNGDRLCMALVAELREMQERMANRQLYEASGRAYMLSGLSSHSWQRATARGDSTDSTTLVHSYQTPSMVQMLEHSQNFGSLPQGRRPQVQGAGSVLEKPSKGR
jgi:DNA-binding GntR family transcriptional regulator